MRSYALHLLFGLCGLAAVPFPLLAQPRPPDLGQISIEDLMNIEVTVAGRKQQRAADVAAAIFVITQDDIRRSGMTTLPDLLRLAPGVDVARINSNKWAVSVRGFNGLYANKLLVLVDGRSVYNQIFAGVLWDAEDLMLDDVDRIEVIRGPGAAMWGANAVNGVINIVTKTAAETRGALVRVDGGGSDQQGAVRYGGTLGAASYRLYSQWTRRGESFLAPDVRADDGSHSVAAGFRTDWTARSGAFVLQGDFTAGRTRALWPTVAPNWTRSDAQSGRLLGRWTHTRAGGASLQVQSFVDIAGRHEPVGEYDRRTFDIDSQYHTTLGAHQDLVVGAGYRIIGERLEGRAGVSMIPAEDDTSRLTVFLQDEIGLFGNRLAVTLGSQLQYDSTSGAGVQPTARVMWKTSPRQRLWAATARALRTPSTFERRIRLDYPPVPTASGLPLVVNLFGNPAAKTERFVDAEAGYRLEIGAAASLDVTGFVGRYDHLMTQEVAAPVVRLVPAPHVLVTTHLDNQLQATTRGLEVAGHWMPVPAWRLDGSYTAFHVTPRLASASLDPAAAREDGSVPRAQWQIRSVFSPGGRVTANIAIFHVGRLGQQQVEAYTRADLNAEWRFTSRLSVMAIGHNLFDAAHAEFGTAGALLLPTQVPRSASVRLRWTVR